MKQKAPSPADGELLNEYFKRTTSLMPVRSVDTVPTESALATEPRLDQVVSSKLRCSASTSNFALPVRSNAMTSTEKTAASPRRGI